MRLLVVTAVEAERSAVLRAGCRADVIVGGVGPVASAVTTSRAVPGYDRVISAGIAGGFAPAALGDVVVASSIAFADLGVETPDGFEALGIAGSSYEVRGDVLDDLRAIPGARVGPVVTVARVTGTAASAADVAARFPGVLAEAMEGFGVAAAAAAAGVGFGEVRAISNAVGPRDRSSWRIPEALDALGAALAVIA